MIFNFSASSFFSVVLICVACSFALIVWNRRPSRGAVPFTVFILSICGWFLFRLLAASAEEWGIKVYLGITAYFLLAVGTIWWLAFASDYSGLRFWRKAYVLPLLAVVPLVSIILVSTAGWHGIEWLSLTPSLTSSGGFVIWGHGPIYWLQMGYLLSLMLAGYIIIWQYTLKYQRFFHKQVVALLFGTLIPIVGMFVFALGTAYFRGVDIVLVTLTIGIVIYALTIFRLRFLDVVPVARNSLVEKIPDGILVLNNEGTIQDINPAVAGIMKVNRKEAVGSHLSRLWPQLDVIYPNLRPGRNIEITADQRCFDLSLTWLSDTKGSLVGHLIVLRDITERQRMEQNLRESESMYSTLVEQSNEMVVIIQEDNIRFTNATFGHINGFGMEEITGRPFLSMVSENDREAVMDNCRRLTSGQPVARIFEFRMICKNGEMRDLEASLGAISYEEKPALILTARDVTERKLTQRKLESLYQEEKHLRGSLQEEIEKRSKYTRALVHELNTPLTSILASGELLESEMQDQQSTALVKNIRRSSDNLKRRIDELIELARGETGLLKINAMPIDIPRLLDEMGLEMQPLVKKSGLTITVENCPKIPLAMGDEGRLRQVLYNLASYSAGNTAAGTIEVKSRLKDEFVEVSVRDRGRGIGPEEMKTLFDPYQRNNQGSREQSGSGIGLSLSKMYIELQGGSIEVESEVGQGSTFRFTVPLYREADLIKKFSQ